MGLCCVYAAFHIHRERQADSQTVHAIGFSSTLSVFPVDTKMRAIDLFIIASSLWQKKCLSFDSRTLHSDRFVSYNFKIKPNSLG